ncbi:winged helix-turn-helix domain-containing protein [Miltoncostaea oceani]|uniref:winged helix-turn-helix domain-containing protein n=1 Tax=Miltoncostaea oceani TaxID=2843216 RepID=UPI001C3D8B63|nr:winged helix-turn-helix domain-containing protein [Miltoncostaea oceani]
MGRSVPSDRLAQALTRQEPLIDDGLHEADRLYAATLAAARRTGNVATELELAGDSDPEPAWKNAAAALRRAEVAIRAAAQMLPEAPEDTSMRRRRMISIGALMMDRSRRVATWSGSPLPLTRLEFDMLSALAERPGEVLGNEVLLREVWGYAARPRTRTICSHASRLRRALKDAGAHCVMIDNAWGIGYRLVLTDGTAAD